MRKTDNLAVISYESQKTVQKENVIVMTLKSKKTGYGYVEIRTVSGGWYGLYINNDLKKQSTDLSFIEREYDRY